MTSILVVAMLFCTIFTTGHSMRNPSTLVASNIIPQQKSFSELSADALNSIDATFVKSPESTNKKEAHIVLKRIRACAEACRAFYQTSLDHNTHPDANFCLIMRNWEKYYPHHRGILETTLFLHQEALKTTFNPKKSKSQQHPPEILDERLIWVTEIKFTISQIHKMNRELKRIPIS